MLNRNKNSGFTLIELLVVIAIIGLLASIILVSLSGARQRARIAKRLADMKQIQTALELYYNDNNAYPVQVNWTSQCGAWGGVAANSVIPGLVPTYIASMPADPAMIAASGGSQNCYLYRSDGTNYKFMDYELRDMNQADLNRYPSFIDPYYNNGGPSPCANNTTLAMSVYSTGWRCQS